MRDKPVSRERFVRMLEAGIAPASSHPKNIQAVIEWVKTNRPSDVGMFERLFAINDPNGPTEAMTALVLIGFEAGRVFQEKHPTIKSGIGYAS
jgi:hypothetical protein